jgi:alkanesulfonate monooxygenase SsuD/methylene tetrahydromethanopterin reductase-like flavin-dependent oxidoreductase (luciferase family)
MAFSFAHFINPQGGPLVMEAYRQNFEPSLQLATPQGAIGIFVICADTEEEALELRWSRDLWMLRLQTGQTGPVPTVEEAKNYPYTDCEWMIVEHNRPRTIVGNPDQVRAQILALGEAYRVDEFVVITISDSFDARLRSYDLLADAFALAPVAVA